MDQQIRRRNKKLDQAAELGIWDISINYIKEDIKKKPRSFKIGFFTVFLVVSFLTLLTNVVSLSPVIFLRVSENTHGDADILMTPISSAQDNRFEDEEFTSSALSAIRLVNITQVAELLKGHEDIVGISPRWYLFGNVSNPYMDDKQVSAMMLLVDPIMERSIGLGRNFDYPPLGRNEVYVSESIIRIIKMYNFTDRSAVRGKNISLSIDFIGALSMGENLAFSDPNATEGSPSIITDIPGFINQTISNLIPFQGNLTIWNATIREQTIALLANFSEAIQSNDDAVLAARRQEFVDQLQEQIDTGQFPIANITAEQIVPIVNSTNVGQMRTLITTMSLTAAVYPDTPIILDRDVIVDRMNGLVNNASTIETELTVKDSVKEPNGKWPTNYGNIMVMRIQDFQEILVNNIIEAWISFIQVNEADVGPFISTFFGQGLEDQGVETIQNFSQELNMSTNSLTANLVLRNRIEIYGDLDKMEEEFIRITDRMFRLMGENYPVSISLPLKQMVTGFLYLKNFLDNINNIVVFILIVLGVLLIYSLMNSNVEEKTYEFGMMRTLGLPKKAIRLLLVLQALSFSLPGFFIGLLSCFIINIMISYLIFDFVQEYKTYNIAINSLILGVIIGFGMPLIANYIPIRRALSKSLKDSMDLYHRIISEMTIKIMKLSKMGISTPTLIASIMLIFFGILTYYVAPAAFIYQKIGLFILLMNTILGLMIVGLTFLINLLQPAVEKLILSLFFCCQPKNEKTLHEITLKNMSAHQKRNSKTALMVSISLAFIIFGGAGTKLEIGLLQDFLASRIGSDMVVLSLPIDESGIDEYPMIQFLEQVKKENPDFITDYTFISRGTSVGFPYTKVTISPLCQYPHGNIILYGVQDNYLQSSLQRFYDPYDYDESVPYEKLSNGKKDGLQGLFTNVGLTSYSDDLDSKNIISQKSIYLLLCNNLPQVMQQFGQRPTVIIRHRSRQRQSYQRDLNMGWP